MQLECKEDFAASTTEDLKVCLAILLVSRSMYMTTWYQMVRFFAHHAFRCRRRDKGGEEEFLLVEILQLEFPRDSTATTTHCSGSIAVNATSVTAEP
jgi:hypothetical protein